MFNRYPKLAEGVPVGVNRTQLSAERTTIVIEESGSILILSSVLLSLLCILHFSSSLLRFLNPWKPNTSLKTFDMTL